MPVVSIYLVGVAGGAVVARAVMVGAAGMGRAGWRSGVDSRGSQTD
jgi:hypothetical protein